MNCLEPGDQQQQCLSRQDPVRSLQESEKHFRTDHLLKNLGARTVSAGFITTGAQILRFFISLGSTVVLARLLTPQDFGLIAMTGTLMSVLRVFREGGLSTATIQKEGITQAQVSNLFWINLVFGAMLSLVGAAVSPVVAWFYRDDRLVPITVFLTLVFAVSGSSVQHLALLTRQMRFTATAVIGTAAAFLGLLIGATCAYGGAGYWSLVIMQLSVACIETIMTWSICRWRPHWPRRTKGMRSLLGFGLSMSFYVLLRRLASAADIILLGRFFGAGAVGVYSRGQALLSQPLNQFIAPFDSVFLPVLSRLQDQPERYKQVYLRAYGVIALLSFPFAGMLLALSEPVVLVLLGTKWDEVVPVFAWLSLAAMHIPMGYAAMWLLTTQARSRDMMLSGMAMPILATFSVAAGLPFGIVGVATAFSLVGLFVRLPVQLAIVGRSGPVVSKDLFLTLITHLPLWAATCGGAWLARHFLPSQPPALQLFVGSLTGSIAGLAVIATMPSLRQEVRFFIDQLRSFLEKPATKV